MGNTIDGLKNTCPPCRKPWPRHCACPGTALVTSSTTSRTPILIHFCLIPLTSYALHIAITSLVLSDFRPVRHPIPRHGEIRKGGDRIASIIPLNHSLRAGTLIFPHIVHPMSLALPPLLLRYNRHSMAHAPETGQRRVRQCIFISAAVFQSYNAA